MELEQQKLVMAEITATEREFHADADREYLFGVSNGAAGAIRMPYNWPHRFAAVVALAPRVQFAGTPRDGEATDRADHLFANAADPFAVLAEDLKDVPLFIGHGADDEVVPVEQSRKLAEALRARGSGVRYHEYPALKHVEGIGRAMDEADLLPWLFAQRLKR